MSQEIIYGLDRLVERKPGDCGSVSMLHNSIIAEFYAMVNAVDEFATLYD